MIVSLRDLSQELRDKVRLASFLRRCKVLLYELDEATGRRVYFGAAPIANTLIWRFSEPAKVYGYAIEDDSGIWCYEQFAGAPFNISIFGGSIEVVTSSLNIGGVRFEELIPDLSLSTLHVRFRRKMKVKVMWSKEGF